MTTAGGFATVVQISEPALNMLARSAHALGRVSHAASWATGTDGLQLAADAPTISLDATSPPGEMRLKAGVRLLCTHWATSDPQGSQFPCTAHVNVRCRIRPSTPADPVPLTADARLVFDESLTTAADVSFPIAIDPTTAGAISTSIVDVLQAQGSGQATLGSLTGQFSSLGVRVLPATGPVAPVMALGLNRNGFSGSAAALTTNFCTDDWAVAIDGKVVLDQVLNAISTVYGGIPLPHGPAPVLIDGQQGAPTYLDFFDLSLTTSVLITGSLRQERGGPFGTITANFNCGLDLSVNAQGGIEASITSPTVTFSQWYATLGNFITGGKLAETVAASVQNALAGGIVQADLGTQIKAITQEIGMSGVEALAPVNPKATAVSVLPDAIVVHGTLGASLNPAYPQPQVRAQLGSSPNTLIFTAAGSWTPGGSIASLLWDFGDGTIVSTAGPSTALSTSHTYSPGGYVVRLSASDGVGHTRSAAVGVTPGQLYCNLVGDSLDEVCLSDPTVRVVVSTSGCLIAGAVVTAEGSGWSVQGTTDAMGRAVVRVDPNAVIQNGITSTKPGPFQLGMFKITAERPGYTSSSLFVWLVDCAAREVFAKDAQRLRDQLMKHLSAHASLSQYLGRGDWVKSVLDNMLYPSGFPNSAGPASAPYNPLNPELDAAAARLRNSLLSYAELVHLSVYGAGAFAEVAGLRLPNSRMIDKLTQQLIKEIDRVGKELDGRLGLVG